MYWKILIILIILTVTVVIVLFGQLIVSKETMLFDENDEKNNIVLKQFLVGGTKKISVMLSRDKFDSLVVPEGMVLYYFPEECPSYDMDIFIVSEKDNAEKYYVPEKNSLLLIDSDHKWTNSFDKYVLWKK